MAVTKTKEVHAEIVKYPKAKTAARIDSIGGASGRGGIWLEGMRIVGLV